MGFMSFFTALLENPLKEHASWSAYSQRQAPATSQNKSGATLTALPISMSERMERDRVDARQERRKSRTFNLPRPKSQSGPKSRRSWFGGRPDDDEVVPAVPMLAYSGSQRDRYVEQAAHPAYSDTNGTALGQMRTRNNTTSQSDRRPSLFGTKKQPTVEALPPLPPMPIEHPADVRTTTATWPAEKRRSRTASVSSQKKRRSFWASSNPDDSDSDVPPVPALVRDGTPNSTNNTSVESVDVARPGIKRQASSKDDIEKSRPLSVSTRKTYVPRAAAKGFLISTSGASEKTRKSYRQSFALNDDADLVCLTEEQRIEWAKLMNDAGRLEPVTPQEVQQTAGEDSGTPKFSNAQALAALEFGVPRR